MVVSSKSELNNLPIPAENLKFRIVWEKVGNGGIRGDFRARIDEKGRLAVPSRIRENLGEKVILTRGLDGCLWMFPESEWKKFAEKILSQPASTQEGRALRRYFIGSAVDAVFDSHGRINIPQSLRNSANLQNEAVLVGQIDRVEIWNPEEWEKYLRETDRKMEKIVEKLGGIF